MKYQYGLSDSSWMDMQLFEQWLIKYFIFHANAAWPLLLLLDGHNSHHNLETATFAKEK